MDKKSIPQAIVLIFLPLFVIACMPHRMDSVSGTESILADHQIGTPTNEPREKIKNPIATPPFPQGNKTAPQPTKPTPGKPTTNIPNPQSDTTSTIVSLSMIADDTIIGQFYNIPKFYIDLAANTDILFLHQSTGDRINYFGFECLAGLRNDPASDPEECILYSNNKYYYDNRNWAWDYWPEHMSDAIAKTEQFVRIVSTQQSKYEIIGMKFCYVDGWNQDFNNYRIKMEQLEQDYPSKVFIWATSALWSDPGTACGENWNSCRLISDFNQQIRNYVHDNDKPLYDIAAIESDGGACIIDGYEGLCASYYSDGGGHPNAQGAIRLAKGFWWLIARLSGWDNE